MAIITLTHPSINSGEPIRLLAKRVQASLKRNLNAKPDVTGVSVKEVQSNSLENPRWTVQNVQLTEEAGTITYAQLLTLLKIQYDGTNPIELIVEYGTNTRVPPTVGAYNYIPVLLEDINPNFDVDDSKDSHIPVVTLIFKETGILE